MRYQVLGSLRLMDGEDNLVIAAHKMEIVLATLLIRANQVVSIDQLIAEIWGQRPPRRATAALYVYVCQLRKLLSDQHGGRDVIVTKAPGYVLRTDGDDLDLHMFERLVTEGRAAVRQGQDEKGRDALAAALALWRGPALGALREGPVITGFALWLEELRLECVELLVEADIRLGRHREQVSVLRGLVKEHPFHEAFYRQLMLALYRSERRADALAVYQSARSFLNHELGLEPGRQLRELQDVILNSRDDLDFKVAV